MFIDLEAADLRRGSDGLITDVERKVKQLEALFEISRRKHGEFRARVINLCREKAALHDAQCSSLFLAAPMSCNCPAERFESLASEIERMPL